MNPVAPLASASCVPTGRLRLRVLSPSTAVGQLRSGQINWRCSWRRETDPLRRLLFFDPAPASERRKHVSQGCSESASRGALVGTHGLAAVRLGVLRPCSNSQYMYRSGAVYASPASLGTPLTMENSPPHAEQQSDDHLYGNGKLE